MTSRVRALVVDDSAFVRKVVRELLTAADIDVVDVARDGLDALEKIERLRPDVITLDLVMPELDGLGVLAALAARPSPPAVVVVSIAGADTEAGAKALAAGAVAIVEKPTALATARLYDIGRDLVEQVRVAAAARPRITLRRGNEPIRRRDQSTPRPLIDPRTEVVVLGTSTGGPQALSQLLPQLPEDFPVPIAIVLHIPPGYTEPLARRLDASSALRVVEAEHGLILAPGTATIARAGMHLALERDRAGIVARLQMEPLLALHRPSVDVLFETAAAACGERTLGLVLTGMGDDGLAGSRAICARGGRVLVESEESCVVYGMPRAVRDAGLASEEAPLRDLAALLTRKL